MQVLNQPRLFRKLPGPIVMAAGFFDGVHMGHRNVLVSTVERARELGGQAWVMTFDRHPLSALAPSKCPPLLCPLEERLHRIEETGVDGVLLVAFTRRLAVLEPETFVRWLCGKPRGPDAGLRTACAAKLSEIRCGENWRFGRRASGTPERLARLGSLYGFRVVVVPYAKYRGLEISSTRIRYAVREGRLDEAAAMLGRPYSVRDLVIRGRGVGASKLAVATANVQPRTEVLPPNGVYAVRVLVDGEAYNGVSNLGVRPTFTDVRPEHAVLETHLLGFSGDLYGKVIEVCFLARLREECVFDSAEALTAQIAEDMRHAARYF